MWLADDRQDYKTHLAASLFADVLRKERTDAVAVGTDKTEQEAQAETKEQTKNVEAHEDEDKKEEQKEEQTQSEKKQEEEKRRNSPEQKEKERREEKAKEEATKAETKAVAAVALSPMLRQFLDLKQKHLMHSFCSVQVTSMRPTRKMQKRHPRFLASRLPRVPKQRTNRVSPLSWQDFLIMPLIPICPNSYVQVSE